MGHLCERQGSQGFKYDRGAPDHGQKLGHISMVVEQCLAEKWHCSEVSEWRKRLTRATETLYAVDSEFEEEVVARRDARLAEEYIMVVQASPRQEVGKAISIGYQRLVVSVALLAILTEQKAGVIATDSLRRDGYKARFQVAG